jgi:hypothetical protein
MYESFLQLRADEIQAERLREAANWRLIRDARAARSARAARAARPTRPTEAPLGRIRRALTRAIRPQSSVASASATSCTP